MSGPTAEFRRRAAQFNNLYPSSRRRRQTLTVISAPVGTGVKRIEKSKRKRKREWKRKGTRKRKRKRKRERKRKKTLGMGGRKV